MDFAKRDEWAIIDLESIRADVKNQFILPVDQYITDNIEIE